MGTIWPFGVPRFAKVALFGADYETKVNPISLVVSSSRVAGHPYYAPIMQVQLPVPCCTVKTLRRSAIPLEDPFNIESIHLPIPGNQYCEFIAAKQ